MADTSMEVQSNRTQEQESFSLSIHEEIDAMQSAHGLGHGGGNDFKQYHGYCTRRLSRLRHREAVKADLVHSSNYVSGVNAKRNAFVARSPPETVANVDVLMVKLVESERAWAQAQELKALLLIQPLPKGHIKSKSTSSQIRQHALQRLKKATKHSNDLQRLACENGYGDAGTQKEALAYASWMRGTLALERSQWKLACDELGLTIQNCQELCEEASLEAADLFNGRIQNTLLPLYRYCVYEYRETGGSLDELKHPVNESKQQNGGNGSSSVGGIAFRGKTIPIENKSLTVSLLKIDGMLGAFDENSDEQLIALLTLYDDALSLIQGDLQQVNKLRAGPAVNSKKDNLRQLFAYVQNGKLQLKLRKQEIRIFYTRDVAELAHLFDALLQDAQQVCDLSSEEEEEDDFFLEANAYVLRVRALRCFYVGCVHANSNRQAEAFALWKQALNLADQASEEIAACEGMEKADEYLEDLEKLKVDVSVSKLNLQLRAVQVKNDSSEAGSNTLLMQLDSEGFEGDELVDLTTTLPVPCKPSFFDTAWNYTHEMPSLREDITAHQPEQTKSSGIMGWFRS